MKKMVVAVLLLMILPLASSQAAPRSIAWPSVEKQLTQDRVIPGSALERIILENQEFHMSFGFAIRPLPESRRRSAGRWGW